VFIERVRGLHAALLIDDIRAGKLPSVSHHHMNELGPLLEDKHTKVVRCFDFMVPFWGQRYREYFVNLCLASLLAPNNLPLLRAADGHRFLIATTVDDWRALIDLPIFAKLREYVTPVLVEVANGPGSAAPGSADVIRHQNVCQKALVEIAYANRSYGCLLWPDIIISDGMIKALLQHAEEGRHLVLCCTLRQTEEAVLAELASTGYGVGHAILSTTCQALALSPRLTGALAVRHLHPDMAIYEANHAHRPFFAPFWYWRVQDHEGIILHSLFASPVLMDYSAIDKHDTACLDDDALENVYLGRNFYACGGLHIVQDSDEFAILSLTPAAIMQGAAVPTARGRLTWFRDFIQHCSIRGSLAFFARRNRDALKRDLFRTPVRWHATDVDDAWRCEEENVSRLLDNAVGDYYAANSRDLRFPPLVSLNPRYLLRDLIVLCHMTPMIAVPVYYATVIIKAMAGYSEQQKLIRNRLLKIWRAAQTTLRLSQ
jgi:hypothetical protein